MSGRNTRYRFSKKFYPDSVVLFTNKNNSGIKYITFGRDKKIINYIGYSSYIFSDLKLRHINYILFDNEFDIISKCEFKDNQYYKYYKLSKLKPILINIRNYIN